MRISDANAMMLRPAFTRVRVYFYDWEAGTTIRTFDRDQILSLSLALNSVETKLENPELVASTIEVKAFFPGGQSGLESLLTQCRAAEQLMLICELGYNEDFERRYFYTSPDRESIYLEGQSLTIKGTDGVGAFMNEDYFGKLIMDYHMYDATHFDTQNMLAQYIRLALHNHPWFANASWRSFLGGPSVVVHQDIYQEGIYFERWSYRKAIAQLANIFRGNISNDTLAKRFVFVDAGTPMCFWYDDAISGTNLYRMSYSDLTDFTVIYGTPLKSVTLDNPYPKISPLTDIDTIYLTAGERTFYTPELTLSEITYVWKTDDHSVRATVEYLSSSGTYIFTAPATGEYTIRGQIMQFLYESGKTPPNVTITGNSSGQEIALDRFAGLSNENGYHIIANALEKTVTDCNLKDPRWIEFTWRGNPHMYPRDIILLTEKDGTKNYYEIDNLTFELSNGGCTSHINAIYKCPYTGV